MYFVALWSTRAAFLYLLCAESVTKRIWKPFKSLLFVDPEQNSTPNTLERSAPALLSDLAKINGQN